MARITLLFLVCSLILVSCDGGNNFGEEECPPNASCLPASDLFGSVWDLKQYTSMSGQIETLPEQTKYQIQLESGTTNFNAFIGCVSVSGSTYEISDGYLVLRLGGIDGMLCITDTEEFIDQKNSIMNILSGGDSGGSLPLMFSTGFRELSLEAADGRVLKFEQIDQISQQQ